ncbi:MAG TPA: PDZ domain-containing protein [Kofleriaceae bacterium]|nr:PDZ domain-containing protein [Kofleriaceae bacterium]
MAFAEDAGGAAGAADRAAEAPVRQKVPLRVVRIMPETNQALVYDRSGGGTHLLVTVGEKIGGYTVEAIDEDEVTLSESGRQIVLAAPARSWRLRSPEARRPAEPSRAPRAEAPAPADPYAGATVSGASPIAAPGPAPADPYAQEIREVRAPSAAAPAAPAAPAPSAAAALVLVDPYPAPRAAAPGPTDPYAEEIREVKAPSWIAPAAASPTPAVAPAPAVTPAPAPSRVASPAPTVAPAPAPGAEPVLTRAEVDAALANFSALAVAFRASFTPEGVKVESVLDGSVFAKAGLRAGDVIASVEGRPLRSLDDVAALYARAGSLRAVTAQVVRGGKPLTLRVSIQ